MKVFCNGLIFNDIFLRQNTNNLLALGICIRCARELGKYPSC